MADDQDFEPWDEEFLVDAIQCADAAVASSSTNPTPLPFIRPPSPSPPPPPPPPPSSAYYSYNHSALPPPPTISYSPPRELSQRPKEEHTHFPDKGFDSLNGINPSYSSRPHHQDDNNSSSKQQQQEEINRLKDDLGRVSKVLANLEQECLELRKDREKNEKHRRLVPPVNGSEDAETFCTRKSNLKNKDPIEDPSSGTKGVIPCKAVGVQTDLTIRKKLSVTRKLVGIWEPEIHEIGRSNLVSKLFVACEADLQVLFGFLGLNIPSTSKKTTAPNHCIQSVEAAKVSHLYLTLTKISYDTGILGDLLEALIDLCCLQNVMIVYRSLCVLRVVLKHILNRENNLSCRDNETSNPRLLISAKNKDNSRPLISSSNWFSLFQKMHQVVTRHCEEIIRVEALSIMNILLLRTDAYTEREMYGEVSIFQCISQLLTKEAAGVGVKKQAVHLLYLLLNCPKLLVMFCSSSKEVEEGTSAEVSRTNAKNGDTFEGLGSVLDALVDCLVCHGNGAPANLVIKLQRNTIVLLAFLASSGRSGFEILFSRRTNFLYLILQVMASEIDLETSECIQPPEDFRERALLIREALILLNRLVSNSQYSTPVLRVLTNRRDMAILTIDIATRLSRKGKLSWQSDTMELEIVDLARIFKKRVFTFLGDAT